MLNTIEEKGSQENLADSVTTHTPPVLYIARNKNQIGDDFDDIDITSPFELYYCLLEYLVVVFFIFLFFHA